MASSKSSKGSGMNQAISPDKAETMGKSGMPHPPYSEGMSSSKGSKGGKKMGGKRR